MSAHSAYFNSLTAVSAIVFYQDIIVSELSGFWVRGLDDSLGIPSVIDPGQGNVTMDRIGVSGNRWGTFDGDLQTRNDLYVSGIVHAGAITLVGCLTTDCIYSKTGNGITIHDGVSSNKWGTFDGDLETRGDLYVSGIATAQDDLITKNDLYVSGTIYGEEGLSLVGCLTTDCIHSKTGNGIDIYDNVNMNGYSISGIGNDSLSFDSGMKISTSNTDNIWIGKDIHGSLDNSIIIGTNVIASTNSINIGSNNVGASSIVLGNSTSAVSLNSIAIGNAAYSYSEGKLYPAVAIGANAVASGWWSTAIGTDAKTLSATATLRGSTVIGGLASGHELDTIIGFAAQSVSSSNVVIGSWARAVNDMSIVIGSGAEAGASGQIVIGYVANTPGVSASPLAKDGICIGHDGEIDGLRSIAIGTGTLALCSDSIVIGANAESKAVGAAQLGVGINSTADSLQFQNVMVVSGGTIAQDSVIGAGNNFSIGGNLTFGNATLSGDGVFTSSGLFLTITVNGSSLYLPLYK